MTANEKHAAHIAWVLGEGVKHATQFAETAAAPQGCAMERDRGAGSGASEDDRLVLRMLSYLPEDLGARHSILTMALRAVPSDYVRRPGLKMLLDQINEHMDTASFARSCAGGVDGEDPNATARDRQHDCIIHSILAHLPGDIGARRELLDATIRVMPADYIRHPGLQLLRDQVASHLVTVEQIASEIGAEL